MNLLDDSSKIQDNQYVYGFNVRSRNNDLRPVRLPVLQDAPAGLKQGLAIFGTLEVLFVAGSAYWRLQGSTTWTLIEAFGMSATAAQIWTCPVPAGTITWKRKRTAAATTEAMYDALTSVSTGPVALVCQDGINQPQVIFVDGAARQCKTYEQWTADDPEYVPIGRQMLLVGSQLVLVAADGKSLYFSVPGRPLDFGINVDAAGNIAGTAATVSAFADTNEITCLRELNSTAFLVANRYNCWSFSDSSERLFGAPIWEKTKLFDAGVVNDNAFTELLGDYAFIDAEGIKSFDAVRQTKWEGRNAVFSKMVEKLFTGIVQDVCCAINFDNYALFSVRTTTGYATLVYDTSTSSWQSVDVFGLAPTQYAISTSASQNRLYCITEENMYEMYAGDYAEPTIFTRAVVGTEDAAMSLRVQLLPKALRVVITDASGPGTFYATLVVDGKRGATYSKELTGSIGGIYYPIRPPVMQDSNRVVDNVVVPLATALQGYASGAWISWTNDGHLLAFSIEADTVTKVNPQNQ